MNDRDIAYRKALGLPLDGDLPKLLGNATGHARRHPIIDYWDEDDEALSA